MPTVRMTISGMMCDGCASRVENGLQDVAGVENAHVDLDQGTAEVRTVAGEGDADEIRKSVETLGYDVTGMNPG